MAPIFVVALSMFAAAQPDFSPIPDRASTVAAPDEGPDAKYCMRIEVMTGTLVETIRCWTREKWADQGIDVDEQWAKDGVRIKK